MFDSPSFDLAAYLARVGLSGRPAPALESLRDLVFAHVTAIPFENLNPFTGRPLNLDIDALQQKLVRDGRGGWCYEHNLLFGHALGAIGFTVTGLAARVVLNVPPQPPRARTHMLLLVDVEGEQFVADVGFGGLTLTGVLRLTDTAQETPHEPFRLVSQGAGYLVEALVRDTWVPQYAFDLQAQTLPDYEMPNWFLSNHPASFFVTSLVAARPDRDRRYALLDAELATHHLHGVSDRCLLGTVQELRGVLEEVFRIRMPEGGDVDAALARAVESSRLRAGAVTTS